MPKDDKRPSLQSLYSGLPLAQALASVANASREYTEALDVVSNEIRGVEEALQAAPVLCDFEYPFELKTAQGKVSRATLMWGKFTSQGFRLGLLVWVNDDPDVDGGLVYNVKPLIDWDAQVRAAASSELPTFLKLLASHVRDEAHRMMESRSRRQDPKEGARAGPSS